MTCLKEAEILHGMCDFPFFLCEKICKHQGDVIVGWNCILSLKYSHFPCPLQWQITEQARRPCSMSLRGIWALGRSSSRSVLWKWLKSRLRACLRCGKFSSPVPSVRCKCKRKQRGPKFKSKGGNKTKDHGYMCKSRQSRVVYMHSDSLNMHIKLAEVNVFQIEIAEIYSSLPVMDRDGECIVYNNNWHWHYYTWACVFVHCCRSWHIPVHARVHSLTLQCVKSERWCWQTAEHLVSKWSPWPPLPLQQDLPGISCSWFGQGSCTDSLLRTHSHGAHVTKINTEIKADVTLGRRR